MFENSDFQITNPQILPKSFEEVVLESTKRRQLSHSVIFSGVSEKNGEYRTHTGTTNNVSNMKKPLPRKSDNSWKAQFKQAQIPESNHF